MRFTFVLVSLILLYKPVESVKNQILFERITCEKTPNSIASAMACEMKYIGRDRIKMNLSVNLSEPLYDAWFHFVFYYRYNGMTYQKFVIDLWENACDWLKGKKSYILDWSFGKVLKYSNLNHTCPYEGHVYFKADNISFNTFCIEQLFPSGRYRIDANVTDGSKKNVLASGQLYFGISDHRIEKW